MKMIAVIVLATLFYVNAHSVRQKRQVEYLLPDGVELILSSPLTTTFRCEESGYYADIDNNCEIFHICDVSTGNDGKANIRQYSFACGNRTIFNQLTFTCAHPEDSIPCSAASQFYRLNERIGKNEPFHNENDLEEAARLIPERQ